MVGGRVSGFPIGNVKNVLAWIWHADIRYWQLEVGGDGCCTPVSQQERNPRVPRAGVKPSAMRDPRAFQNDLGRIFHNNLGLEGALQLMIGPSHNRQP